MTKLQVFKTMCINCNEEVESRMLDLTGENEIIIDFLEGMEFKCKSCGTSTYINELEKYSD